MFNPYGSASDGNFMYHEIVRHQDALRHEVENAIRRSTEWRHAFNAHGRTMSPQEREEFFVQENKLMAEANAHGTWYRFPVTVPNGTKLQRLYGPFDNIRSAEHFCKLNSSWNFGANHSEQLRSGALLGIAYSQSTPRMFESVSTSDIMTYATHLLQPDHLDELNTKLAPGARTGFLKRVFEHFDKPAQLERYELMICFNDADEGAAQMRFPSAKDIVEDHALRQILTGEQRQLSVIRTTTWKIWLEETARLSDLGQLRACETIERF